MSDIPQFFVPAATDEEKESVYASFAESCRVSIPTIEKRIYSIVFRSNGETWTATVGETLRGIRPPPAKSRSSSAGREQSVSDPALVLAIFPGSPYQVVTNHGIAGNVGSRWANPFLAGEPTSVTYFAQ